MLYHKEKILPDVPHDSATCSGAALREAGMRKAVELLEQAVRGGHSLAKCAAPPRPARHQALTFAPLGRTYPPRPTPWRALRAQHLGRRPASPRQSASRKNGGCAPWRRARGAGRAAGTGRYQLATMYAQGEGVDADQARARRLFQARAPAPLTSPIGRHGGRGEG